MLYIILLPYLYTIKLKQQLKKNAMNYNEILEMIFKGLVKAEMINSGKSQIESKKIVMEYMKSEEFYQTFKTKLIESVK